jgi:hypothetical protein
MAQTSKAINQQRNVIPIGPGGSAGRVLRMLVMVCTGGFMYPNTFVEGMDLTAIDKAHQAPYQKSGADKSQN